MLKALFLFVLLSIPSSALALLDDVSNLRLVDTGQNFAEIEFDSVENATSYTLLLGTKSVDKDALEYNLPPVIMGDNTRYKVSNLKLDREYFMSVFATSENDKSENLSNELKVSLSKETITELPSEITSLEILDSRTLQIAFATGMQFSDSITNDLSILKKFNSDSITIDSFEVLNQNTIKVILEQELDPNFDYQLLLLPSFVDVNGNSLFSQELIVDFSTEDDLVEYVDLSKLPELTILSAVAFDQSAFEVTFSTAIKKDPDLINQVRVIELGETPTELEVINVLFNEFEAEKLLIITKSVEQKDYRIEFDLIQSDKGKLITPSNATINVENKPIASSAPIEFASVEQKPISVGNISKLQGLVDATDPSKVSVSFEKPNAEDIKEYKVLIENKDGKSFDLLEIVSKDLSKVVLDLGTPVTEQKRLKVVSVDNQGNESTGVITKLLIPETGPATALITLIGSGLAGAVISRRRK